ncbi:hypothetical protein C5Y96_16085 [Blastopirellula marina]|uniref:Uncharacterized protein n=1 Tax=Blastopirellula marina TaxID=124 RepID=A0A2S8F8D5_9BACT|nr:MULTISPECIES: hypothetical protein [Pirellulaceae]PQO28405.1 hypothetical protein C5Y96_16085 [Blastopirellula marina]RCS49111.1 hypothetical protein DTL36_16105 [Bremerella cremea]
MNQEGLASYTLRRAAGGHGNFARVLVGFPQNAPDHINLSGDGEPVTQEWLDAAYDGIQYAKKTLNRTDKVLPFCIEGSLADTRIDTIFCAAAIATSRLFGENGWTEFFDGEKWIITNLDEKSS